MKLGRRIALEPTVEAQQYCWRAAGTRRFAWNWGLRRWEEDYAAYKAAKDPETRKSLKPSASRYKAEWAEVRRTEFPWSYEVTKCAGTQAILDLGETFKRAIQECADARREKRARRPMFGFPRPKRKFRNTPSFALWNDQIEFTVVNGRQYVRLPHVGMVRMRELLPSMGGILGAVVSFRRGRWMIAAQFDTD
jgi:putative transposase